MKCRDRPKALGVLDVEELIIEARKDGRTIIDLCKKYRVSGKSYFNAMNNKISSEQEKNL